MRSAVLLAFTTGAFVAISLDQLNATFVASDVYVDRWMFQLEDEFNGPVCGAVFDAGKTTEPVDFRVIRKFVVNFGPRMVGAMRVVGQPAEIGDCTGLKPAEPETPADDADEEPESDTQSDAPKAKRKRGK